MPWYIQPYSLVPWEWLYYAMIYSPHCLIPQEWLYYATIYPPPLSSSTGVIILCHDISTPILKLHGSDYITPRYIHPHSLVPREWLYHATIYPPPLSSSMGVIMSCHDISTPTLKFHGTGNNILCNTMSTPLSSCVTRSWSWHIFTPDNIWGGGDYIMKIYSYSQQYLGRG